MVVDSDRDTPRSLLLCVGVFRSPAPSVSLSVAIRTHRWIVCVAGSDTASRGDYPAEVVVVVAVVLCKPRINIFRGLSYSGYSLYLDLLSVLHGRHRFALCVP